MAAAKEKLHELEAKQPADAKLKKKQGVNTVFSKQKGKSPVIRGTDEIQETDDEDNETIKSSQ